MSFQLINNPVDFRHDRSVITMVASRGTNLFNDMCSDYKGHNFPFYYETVKGDFVIRCKISPEFKKTYDLGCIVIFDNENKWIKFAYENADTGYPSMVSVVTNGVSDDSNGEKINENGVWMQVLRKGNNFALHYSQDRVNWKLVRIFCLEMSLEVKVGISAQSPIGDQCTVRFEGLEIMDNSYTHLRKLK